MKPNLPQHVKYRKQPGTVLVLVALLMVVLLGMMALAVDLSRMYIAREYLINACDASALAGGSALPSVSHSSAQASSCATANGMAVYEISFPAAGMTTTGADQIRVDGSLLVKSDFANILGFASKTVTAYAIAQRSTPGWVNNGARPWGVPFYDATGNPYQYNAGQEYVLKQGSSSDLADGSVGRVGGNFFALALGGNGGSKYRSNIESGYAGTLAVGDMISTEPGNLVGPTKQGVSDLLDQASVAPYTNDTWDNFHVGNPRIIVTPIVSPMGNGRMDVEILGFGAFFLDDMQNQALLGYFIGYTIPDAGGSGPDYGASIFRLAQ